MDVGPGQCFNYFFPLSTACWYVDKNDVFHEGELKMHQMSAAGRCPLEFLYTHPLDLRHLHHANNQRVLFLGSAELLI